MTDAVKGMQSLQAKFKASKDNPKLLFEVLEDALSIVTKSDTFKTDAPTYYHFAKDFTIDLLSAILRLQSTSV